MSGTKRWWQSKINWAGILSIVVAVANTISFHEDVSPDWRDVFLLVSGIATLIMRTYFTTKEIS